MPTKLPLNISFRYLGTIQCSRLLHLTIYILASSWCLSTMLSQSSLYASASVVHFPPTMGILAEQDFSIPYVIAH